jgi:biotin operon repressor
MKTNALKIHLYNQENRGKSQEQIKRETEKIITRKFSKKEVEKLRAEGYEI